MGGPEVGQVVEAHLGLVPELVRDRVGLGDPEVVVIGLHDAERAAHHARAGPDRGRGRERDPAADQGVGVAVLAVELGPGVVS